MAGQTRRDVWSDWSYRMQMAARSERERARAQALFDRDRAKRREEAERASREREGVVRGFLEGPGMGHISPKAAKELARRFAARAANAAGRVGDGVRGFTTRVYEPILRGRSLGEALEDAARAPTPYPKQNADNARAQGRQFSTRTGNETGRVSRTPFDVRDDVTAALQDVQRGVQSIGEARYQNSQNFRSTLADAARAIGRPLRQLANAPQTYPGNVPPSGADNVYQHGARSGGNEANEAALARRQIAEAASAVGRGARTAGRFVGDVLGSAWSWPLGALRDLGRGIQSNAKESAAKAEQQLGVVKQHGVQTREYAPPKQQATEVATDEAEKRKTIRDAKLAIARGKTAKLEEQAAQNRLRAERYAKEAAQTRYETEHMLGNMLAQREAGYAKRGLSVQDIQSRMARIRNSYGKDIRADQWQAATGFAQDADFGGLGTADRQRYIESLDALQGRVDRYNQAQARQQRIADAQAYQRRIMEQRGHWSNGGYRSANRPVFTPSGMTAAQVDFSNRLKAERMARQMGRTPSQQAAILNNMIDNGTVASMNLASFRGMGMEGDQLDRALGSIYGGQAYLNMRDAIAFQRQQMMEDARIRGERSAAAMSSVAANAMNGGNPNNPRTQAEVESLATGAPSPTPAQPTPQQPQPRTPGFNVQQQQQNAQVLG